MDLGGHVRSWWSFRPWWPFSVVDTMFFSNIPLVILKYVHYSVCLYILKYIVLAILRESAAILIMNVFIDFIFNFRWYCQQPLTL